LNEKPKFVLTYITFVQKWNKFFFRALLVDLLIFDVKGLVPCVQYIKYDTDTVNLVNNIIN
jgi:hypothetical protein